MEKCQDRRAPDDVQFIFAGAGMPENFFIEDSKAKAAVLSTAAGVRLGEILIIDYSWGEADFVARPMNDLRMCCAVDAAPAEVGIDLDIEADDIEVEDTVTVVWGIE